MQKHLLTTTLAIIGSFVIGSSALAAPGVAYKKQLTVPTVPATTVSKIAAMGWQMPTTASSTNGLGTFKNVVLKKPVIVDEKECGDVIYRMWAVGVDVDATKKMQSSITKTDAPYYGISYGTRYVFEARSPSVVKWHIDQMHLGIYDFDHPTPNEFFSCKNKDIVVEYVAESPRSDVSHTMYRTIAFTDFATDAGWNKTIKDLGTTTVNRGFDVGVNVDGIHQTPGILRVYNKSISGDSRIAFADTKNGLQIHNPPHYRDLNNLPEGTWLKVLYYKTKDGYIVIEDTYGINNSNDNRAYYSIRNGDAQYKKIESSPIAAESLLSQSTRGLALATATAYTVFHGLPATGYTATGSIVWETNDQAYVRYTITNTATGKQQYWEATVNKK